MWHSVGSLDRWEWTQRKQEKKQGDSSGEECRREKTKANSAWRDGV